MSAAADAERDVRGFALKLYAEQGNWDLVGNNTPVFFVRDPYKFPDFIRTQKRDPRTNLRNLTALWDFWSLCPESLHQVTILFSDRGIPLSYRHMNGYGSHTYSLQAPGDVVPGAGRARARTDQERHLNMTRDPFKTVSHETRRGDGSPGGATSDRPGGDGDLPVTVTINHTARPEKIGELEATIDAAIKAFATLPGFRSAQLFRPTRPGDGRFQVVLSFDRMSDFMAWQSSAVRGEWLKKIEPLIQSPAQRELRTGVAPWFDLPGHETSRSPHRYKMAIVGWLGALPTASVVQTTIIPLLGDAPVLVRLAILTALVSLLLSYLVMPGITRLFAKWLYPVGVR